MEKEKLIIKNFGPIKSVDLDLGKITVLIGEQASGKSTIAKVLAVCRYFSYIIDDSESIVNYKSNFSNTALVDWGLDGFEILQSYIEYENEDYKVIIEYKEHYEIEQTDFDGTPDFIPVPLFTPKLFPKSKKFKNLLAEYEKLRPKKRLGLGIYPDWQIPHSFLTTEVKSVMDNPLFIPTERGLQSIFSIGKRGLENLNDRLYEQLAALNGLSANFKKEIEIEPLHLQYKYENGQGKFKGSKDLEYLYLAQGASGYQSTIPIVLAIKFYGEIEKRKRSYIIEEPELNLFPKTQKKLVEFFAKSINQFHNQFILPTHSPYILTTLSNLIYANRLGTVENGKYEEEVNKIISQKSWIDVNNLSVYYLNFGKANDMVNVKDCIINLDNLDNVSELINKEFDELLNIENKHNLNE